MSTIADRMAAAFKEVTGLSFVPSDDRRISTERFIVTAYREPASRRYTFKAERFIMDSTGRVMVAESEADCTSVRAMVGAMREADRRARVLRGVSDRLTEDGWTIDPMIGGLGSGITAHRNGVAVMIHSDGRAVSSNLMAQIYTEAVVRVIENDAL